jgi:hypothetical protein
LLSEGASEVQANLGKLDMALAVSSREEKKKLVDVHLDSLLADSSNEISHLALREQLGHCADVEFSEATLEKMSQFLKCLRDANALTMLTLKLAMSVLQVKAFPCEEKDQLEWERTHMAYLACDSEGDADHRYECAMRYGELEAYACVQEPENLNSVLKDLKAKALDVAQAQTSEGKNELVMSMDAVATISEGVEGGRSWKADLTEASSMAEVVKASDYYFFTGRGDDLEKEIEKRWSRCEVLMKAYKAFALSAGLDADSTVAERFRKLRTACLITCVEVSFLRYLRLPKDEEVKKKCRSKMLSMAKHSVVTTDLQPVLFKEVQKRSK